MPDLPVAQILTFLEALKKPAALDGKVLLTGQFFLINLLESCEEKLVNPADALAFLRECATQPGDGTMLNALAIVEAVSTSKDQPDTDSPRYSRLCKQASFESDSNFITVTTYAEFAHYLYDPGQTRVQPRLLPADGPESNRKMELLERDIGRATARPGWFKPGALLGRPQPLPRSCWISVDRFQEPSDSQAVYDGDESPTRADTVRDELGIVLSKGRDHLMRYKFTASSGVAATANDMARPTFADDGDWRFRARQSCDRSRQMAEAGWGCAVHLGRVPNPGLHPPTGNAVRVVRPMRLSELKDLQVEYLHRTHYQRDDDATLIGVLLGDRTIDDVITDIQQFLTSCDHAVPDAG